MKGGVWVCSGALNVDTGYICVVRRWNFSEVPSCSRNPWTCRCRRCCPLTRYKKLRSSNL